MLRGYAPRQHVLDGIRSATRAAGGSWHSYLPDFRLCTGQGSLLMTSESVGIAHISMAVLW